MNRNTRRMNPTVQFKTSQGEFTVELYPKEAPITVENFLRYVDDGFFDGTIFHRVVPGFVIQGGGLTAEFEAKPTRAPIKNEANNGLQERCAARCRWRAPTTVNSATSQFFVNLKDNAFLDHKAGNFGYAVFGKVTSRHGRDRPHRQGAHGPAQGLRRHAARSGRDRIRAPRRAAWLTETFQAMTQRSLAGWLWRGLVWLVTTWIVLTVLVVLALRWVDPPFSAFMLDARLKALSAGDRTYRQRHRWVDYANISALRTARGHCGGGSALSAALGLRLQVDR